MPEETIVQPPVETPDVKLPSNFDNELDAALSKSFNPTFQPKEPNEIQPTESNPEKQNDKKDAKEGDDKAAPRMVERVQKVHEESDEGENSPKMSKENKSGWNALKENYKKAQRTAQEKEDEIKKLKSSFAEKGTMTQKEVDALKAQIDDLSKYRAMIDIQADPEFISKYDQPIEKSVSSIKEMLLGLNVSEAIVNQIDFSNTKLMDEIIGHVGEHKDKFIARKLQRKVEDLIDLSDKRDETLSSQRENYKKFLEEKKKENFSKEAEGEGRIYKHLENVAQGINRDGEKKFEPIVFLNKITPKEGSSQLEIDQIDNHNRMVEMMTQKVQQAVKLTSPEDKAEMAIAAVASHYLNAQLKAASAKIKSLEDELKKISSVNNETVKSKTTPNKKTEGQVDLDSSLQNFFTR